MKDVIRYGHGQAVNFMNEWEHYDAERLFVAEVTTTWRARASSFVEFERRCIPRSSTE